MSTEPEGIPLLGYAAMVWRRRFLVLALVLAMVVPAVAVSALETRQYQAVAQILLASQKIDENFNIDNAPLTDTQIGNLIAILTSTEVAAAARAAGGLADVAAVGKASTNLVTIRALDTDPQRAARTIDAYVTAFSDYLTRGERQTLDAAATQQQNRITRLSELIAAAATGDQAGLQEQRAALQEQLARIESQKELVTAGITVVQAPATSSSPVSPTPVRNGLLAVVLGLALGVSVAILLETLRRRSDREVAVASAESRYFPLEPEPAVEPQPEPGPTPHRTPPSPGPDVAAPTNECTVERPRHGPTDPATPRPLPSPAPFEPPRHRAPSPSDVSATERLPVVPPQAPAPGPDLRRARPAPHARTVAPRQS